MPAEVASCCSAYLVDSRHSRYPCMHACTAQAPARACVCRTSRALARVPALPGLPCCAERARVPVQAVRLDDYEQWLPKGMTPSDIRLLVVSHGIPSFDDGWGNAQTGERQQ